MIFGLIFKSMSVHHSRPFDHVLLLFVRERGSADSVGRSLLATEADVAGKFVHPDYSRHLAVVTDAARSIGAGLQAADEHCYGDSSGLARHLNSDLILAESRGAVRGYTVGILIPDPSYKSLNGPESAKFCLHSTNSIERFRTSRPLTLLDMFACIVAGRPAQEAAQVAPDRFVFQLQDAAHVNHLVVFAASQPFF